MGSEIVTYLHLGMRHIADLRGYDHILFVAALSVAYRPTEWRRLLWLVTAFTLGHSATLALATLSLVHANTRVVETGIAATIVITSLLAILVAARSEPGAPTPVSLRAQRLRYLMAVGFGLIHGLGFSTFLRSLLGEEQSILLPLVSFNVGLEVGQLAIVGGVLLLGVLAERGARFARRDWVVVSSTIIAAVGSVMLVERLRG